MLKLAILAALAALSAGCVMPGDLERISAKVDQLDLVLDDPLATVEEVKEAVAETKEEVAAVSAEAHARSNIIEELAKGAGLSMVEVGGIAGGITTIATILLSIYRDRKHTASDKVVKEETKAEMKTEIKAAGGVA